MKDNRGRPSLTGKKRGRPPKLDKKVEEDLIAENKEKVSISRIVEKLVKLLLIY